MEEAEGEESANTEGRLLAGESEYERSRER